MSDAHLTENDWWKRLMEVIRENLSNERFGVSELAQELGMSRSNLLRKVKKQSGLSVSQFIRNVRLQRSMELLKETSSTVSEISFQVGFSSTSYFIKCFREHYGYPPGEAEEKAFDESQAIRTSQSHQLAAIMFTDIEGYTALMQQDEEKALEIRDRHREVFNTVTGKFHGKILQYYGDGTLSIFASAVDAVKCGIEMQRGFRSVLPIPVRIGIHSGDIILREEEIIGDGVNVASRIESLAVAGSVFISEKIYDEIKNQPDIETKSLGTFEFKNIDKPLEVYSVTNPGLIVPEADQLTGKLKSKVPGERQGSGSGLKKLGMILLPVALITLVIVGMLYLTGDFKRDPQPVAEIDQSVPEKSIAVLPFINDSNDSTNVYIINGLMESILNHLQKIEDLRVISRTSVERYRNHSKTISEIARELGVRYLVEGSGQKIGDQILLNIQLIDAPGDRNLWSEQYSREATDIFNLQREVAKKITEEIQVIITPEEEKRLEEVPTRNLAAYDAFLKGLDLFYKGDREHLRQAMTFYQQAIELDPEFARAYAGIAIAYYFLDYDQVEKHYADQINSYADKALLYGPQLPQSLIAKALYYLYQGEYASALPHLEKALEYHPNSALVINILADFYTRYVPDTEKYLEYAIKGSRLDIADHNSSEASFIYLHIGNALAQSGFIEEAEWYIDKSLDYDPENLFSAYVKAFILYAKNRDLAQTRDQLLEVLSRDPTRLDIMQEVAKLYYFMRDYEKAYRYYQKFTETKEALNLDIYPFEDAKIAMVMRKTGRQEEAARYIRRFSEHVANDQSIYRHLNEAVLSAFQGDTQQAIGHFRQFSEEDNYHYWIILFLEVDPLMEEIKTLPAFQEIMRNIENKFWDRHERMKTALEEQNLL